MNKPNCSADPVILNDIYMTERDLRAYARALCHGCPVFTLCDSEKARDGGWRIRAGVTLKQYRAELKKHDLTMGIC